MKQSLSRALRRWFAASHTSVAAAQRRRSPRTRPMLEGLEERAVPAGSPLAAPGATAALVGDAVPGTPTVHPASTNVTVTNLSAGFNSSSAQQVTLSASVTSSTGGTVNEGTVTFFVKGQRPLRAAVNSSGVASATLTLPAGFVADQWTIAAFYRDTGNANGEIHFLHSHNWGLLTVNPAATTTVAANVSAPFDPLHSQQVVLTATVTSATGGTVNEGTVTFFLVPNQPVTAAVNSSGAAAAVLTLPAGFPAGSYPVYATYTDAVNSHGTVNYVFSNNVLDPATLTIESTAVSAAAPSLPGAPPHRSP
jgi:hypothetical protein